MTILFLRQSKITNVHFPKDIYKPILSGIFAAIILYLLASVFNFDQFFINYASSLITQTDIISEILLKFLKVSILGIFVLIAFFIVPERAIKKPFRQMSKTDFQYTSYF